MNVVVEKYHQHYPTSPATLQELSSIKLALTLWHLKDVNSVEELTQPFSSKETNIRVELKEIRELIDDRIQSVGNELKNLFDHLKENIFFGDSDKDIIKRCLDSTTFESTYEILNSFKIASLYCGENNVEEIRILLVKGCQLEVMKKSNCMGRRAVRHWIDRIGIICGEPLIYLNMFVEFGIVYWPALDYLLEDTSDTCSWRARVLIVDRLLEEREPENLKYLLPKLSKILIHMRSIPYNATKIYSDCLKRLWTTFIKYEYDRKGLFSFSWDDLWNEVFIWYQSITFDFFTIHCSKVASITLYEILTEIPPELKYAILDDRVENFFHNLDHFDCTNRSVCYDLDMRFFLQLFNEMKFERRNKIWRKYWHVLVIRARPEILKDFLNLCMRDQNDIDQFVDTEMMNYSKLEYFFKFLMENKLYNCIFDYIKLSSNEILVRDLAKQIITSTLLPPKLEAQSARYLILAWLVDLNKLIDCAFDNVDERRVTKKKMLLLEQLCNYFIYKMGTDVPFSIEQLDEMFSLFDFEQDLKESKRKFFKCWRRYVIDSKNQNNFSLASWGEFLWWCGVREISLSLYSNPDFFRMKREFIENWQKCILSDDNTSEFDISQWQDIVMWFVDCEVDDTNLTSLKESLKVDEIFEKLLFKAVSKLSTWLGSLECNRIEPRMPEFLIKTPLEEFIPVNDFLTWYFVSREAVENYKLTIIYNLEENPGIERLLQMKNECAVNDVLRWFFDDDTRKIDQFKLARL